MEEERITISVPEHKTQERLDTFLVNQMSHVSRSRIQKLIKEGLVQIDGNRVKSHHVVRPSEEIVVVIPKPKVEDIVPDIVFYLDVVPEDGLLKATGRSSNYEGGDRIEREGLELQRRVRESYLRLARRHSRQWVVLQPERSIEEIGERVFKETKRRIRDDRDRKDR